MKLIVFRMAVAIGTVLSLTSMVIGAWIGNLWLLALPVLTLGFLVNACMTMAEHQKIRTEQQMRRQRDGGE